MHTSDLFLSRTKNAFADMAYGPLIEIEYLLVLKLWIDCTYFVPIRSEMIWFLKYWIKKYSVQLFYEPGT